jgi:uncharacterized protein YndB with AHSA1/START domain
MASARKGEVRIHIDAPPEAVWTLVADVERMGEWSPECYRVEWLDGASSPAITGARFQGWNRYDEMRWSVICEVKTAEPGRELAWSTLEDNRELVRWRYCFEPADCGTDLTESFEVVWLPPTAAYGEDVLMRDRDWRRAEAMRTTLQRIKDVAEAAK